MKFHAALSTAESASKIVNELVDGIAPALGGDPDFAALFFTAPLMEEARALVERLRSALSPRAFLAVSAESVLANGVEAERRPAAALLAGTLPGVELRPFHLGTHEWRTLLEDPERLQLRVGTGQGHAGQLLLADPFTTPVDHLLPALDRVLQTPTVGGMASAAMQQGGNFLALDDQFYTEGAIGVGLGGAVQLGTLVSQGCKPIGQPMVVTKSDGNVLLELGRRPALTVAREVLNGLSAEEQEELQSGLLVGVVIDEYRSEFRRGDFLVRQFLGADANSGALAVGEMVRPGQTIQFHLRDAQAADQDLRELLQREAEAEAPAGALVFTCNGRGTRMFSQPDHDSGALQEQFPGLAHAGFFAMGELGPIGGRSFIHGHTASLAIFRPAP